MLKVDGFHFSAASGPPRANREPLMEVDFGGEADELLEILGDELRPAVTDDARPGLGKLQRVPLGPCRQRCRPSIGVLPRNGAVAVRPQLSRSNLPGATKSIKAHERPGQRLCNMPGVLGQSIKLRMPHFRRARRQSGARAQCGSGATPLSISTRRRAVESFPRKGYKKEIISAKSGTL